MSAVSEPVVHVSELTKIFKVPEREAGLRAAAKAQTRAVCAVDAISFEIGAGARDPARSLQPSSRRPKAAMLLMETLPRRRSATVSYGHDRRAMEYDALPER